MGEGVPPQRSLAHLPVFEANETASTRSMHASGLCVVISSQTCHEGTTSSPLRPILAVFGKTGGRGGFEQLFPHLHVLQSHAYNSLLERSIFLFTLDHFAETLAPGEELKTPAILWPLHPEMPLRHSGLAHQRCQSMPLWARFLVCHTNQLALIPQLMLMYESAWHLESEKPEGPVWGKEVQGGKLMSSYSAEKASACRSARHKSILAGCCCTKSQTRAHRRKQELEVAYVT